MTNYNTQSQQVKLYDRQSQATLVAPNLWTVQDCFSDQTLDWLKKIYLDEKNEFAVVRPHGRLLLKYGDDVARLGDIGRAMIPGLSQIVGEPLNFMDAKFWLDLPGFGCQIHRDASDIIVSCQIYIDVKHGENWPCHGVSFTYVNPPLEIALLPNYGYVNYNVDGKLHEVVNGGGTRQSVIFQFNRV